jgi:aspartate aminotransferase
MGKTTPAGAAIQSELNLVQLILREAGVALIDGSSYGVPGTFRVSFASSLDDVREGCEAIRGVCRR